MTKALNNDILTKRVKTKQSIHSHLTAIELVSVNNFHAPYDGAQNDY